MPGWICLHRDILDDPDIMRDSDYLAVWVHLQLNATHKNRVVYFDGKKITLTPGQLITKRSIIQYALKISVSKIQRVLECFQNETLIEQQMSNRNRLITLINWVSEQNGETQNETPMKLQRNSNETPMKLTTINNNETMEQGNNEEPKPKENIKQKKPISSEILNADLRESFDFFWSAYPNKKAKGDAERAWKKISPDKEKVEQIMRGLENYMQYDTRFIGGFVSMPATWLNKKEWENSYSTSYQPKSKNEFTAAKNDEILKNLVRRGNT